MEVPPGRTVTEQQHEDAKQRQRGGAQHQRRNGDKRQGVRLSGVKVNEKIANEERIIAGTGNIGRTQYFYNLSTHKIDNIIMSVYTTFLEET